MTAPSQATERRVLAELRRLGAGQAPTVTGAALAGDIERVFALHSDRVYGLCLRLVRDPDRARELAQETMLRAWQGLAGFRGESGLGTWLYVIARNLCFQSLRKRSELLTDDGVLEVDSAGADALRLLQVHEREELLRQAAAATLEPLEQEAVYLRYVEGLGQEEITRILALEQASGARGLLQRCRRKLKRELLRRLEELGHRSTFVRVTH